MGSEQVTDSFELGMREAARLGLTPSFETARRALSAVTSCHLTLEDRPVMTGLGRGEGEHARTVALFEALERYAVRCTPADGRHRISDLVKQAEIGPSDVVHRIARSHPDAAVETWTYAGRTGQVRYPTVVVNPFLATAEIERGQPYARPYLRYSSGVGTAAGTTIDQAVLHGLLELIEHDAVSLAFLGWFVDGTSPMKVVARSGMPDEVTQKISEITTTTGRSVHLADVTTDLAIPAFLAILEHPDGDIPIQGSAASCSPVTGALRALGEVEQMWALYGHPPDIERSLERWPVLERCRRLPVRNLKKQAAAPDWSGQAPRPTEEILRVQDALGAAGFATFQRTLSEADSHIAVVSCLVPGLERFSLVRSGSPVLPTGRGRPIWERSLRTR